MRHGKAVFMWFIFLALFLSWEANAGHKKTDKVTTTEGSVLVGEIKSMELATLNLSTTMTPVHFRSIGGTLPAYRALSCIGLN